MTQKRSPLDDCFFDPRQNGLFSPERKLQIAVQATNVCGLPYSVRLGNVEVR